MTFEKIRQFEDYLSLYTGAPYVIMTDCCTHALELCFRYDQVKECRFTPHTYISIPMLMEKLNIRYGYVDTYMDTTWIGEYQFYNTRIWDSARLLKENMYRPGQLQCLSFGYDKPLNIGHGGAILLDDQAAYQKLIRQRYDGRDLNITPWEEQTTFEVGYHYKPTPEDAARGLELIGSIDQQPKYKEYPDLRKIIIK
jgi:dTDP-4-amino-4,6-dideoxygalactose transaminase